MVKHDDGWRDVMGYLRRVHVGSKVWGGVSEIVAANMMHTIQGQVMRGSREHRVQCVLLS